MTPALTDARRARLVESVRTVLVAITTNAEEAETLRERRSAVVASAIEAGITQAELAEVAGVSAERVRQWLREARS